MTSIQKLIKLIADAIAIGLVISIVGSAATLIITISGVKAIKNEIKEAQANEELSVYSVENNINNISLDLAVSSLAIKKGDKFSVCYSDGFGIRSKNGILYIEDDATQLLDFGDSRRVIITVPEKKVLDKVSISSGLGSVYIEKLICNKLDLDLGVGSTDIDYIKATAKSEIDGGIGNITVKGGLLGNLDYSVGIGKSDITAKLSGNSEIEAGIGDVKLNLLGGQNIYTLKGEAGIGPIRVGSETLSGKMGVGENKVDIDGGIGAVRIDFAA